jgi:glycogen debranching enzyme
MISGGQQGLFSHQTRLLSCYRYSIDGKTPQPIALSNVEQHSWLGYYGLIPPGTENKVEEKSVAQHTLEMRISRYVGGGVHEDLDLTNFTRFSTTFWLEIEIDADFADPAEIETGERQQQGELRRIWQQNSDGHPALSFDYTAEHQFDVQGNHGVARLRRGVVLSIPRCDSLPEHSSSHIRFPVTLGPRGTWHACLNISPVLDGEALDPAYACRSFFGTVRQPDANRHSFLKHATRFGVPSGGELSFAVGAALEQAKRDLVALRLDDLRHGDGWIMAAGLPVYLALFGRDTLTSAWQAALSGPEMMQGTLLELVRWQGKEVNDWRDEQPGRMLHEAQTGPLAMLNYTPRGRYYGAVTTSTFYPVVVSELWHWTGDEELVKSVLQPALKALKWLDQYGDNDRDGFYDYRCRSIQGNANQGWKDFR